MSNEEQVNGLAEFWVERIGVSWDGLTLQQKENYRVLARERIAVKMKPPPSLKAPVDSTLGSV